MAIEDLICVDREVALRALVPGLRARLRDKKERRPLFAVFHLAELGDRESLPAIRELAATARVPRHRDFAAVACLLLEGRGDEILRRLREHDHPVTTALARAALLLGTPEALEAVERCAAAAPDEECRKKCRWQLEQVRGVRVFRAN